jgi:hypothetical protein
LLLPHCRYWVSTATHRPFASSLWSWYKVNIWIWTQGAQSD